MYVDMHPFNFIVVSIYLTYSQCLKVAIFQPRQVAQIKDSQRTNHKERFLFWQLFHASNILKPRLVYQASRYMWAWDKPWNWAGPQGQSVKGTSTRINQHQPVKTTTLLID